MAKRTAVRGAKRGNGARARLVKRNMRVPRALDDAIQHLADDNMRTWAEQARALLLDGCHRRGAFRGENGDRKPSSRRATG